MNKKIEQVMSTWTSNALPDGRTINTLLQVDGIPLWWAFERFITSSLLPKLPSFRSLCDQFEKHEKPSSFPFRSLLICQFLNVHEKFKWRRKKNVIVTPAPKALFLTYRHHIFYENNRPKIYRVAPVIDQMKKKNFLEPFVLVVDSLSRRPSSSTDYPVIYDFITSDIKKMAARTARELATAWKSVSVPEREALLMVGKGSFYPYVAAHLSVLFSRPFLSLFLTYYFTLKDIIARCNIRCFYLTATIGFFEKCCLFAANVLHIPVFVAQHGSGVGFGQVPSGLLGSLTFLVFGKKHRELLATMGIPEEKIVVTGSPMVDEIAHFVPLKSSSMEKMLILTQPFVEDKLWMAEQRTVFFGALHRIMLVLSGISFAIKIHPREKKELYEKEFPGVLVSDQNLYEEIKQADIVLGVTSTALMEALLLNKPAVVLDLFDQGMEIPYVACGLALRVAYADSLASQITDYFTFYSSAVFDKKRREFIADYFYALDGRAAGRIVHVLERASQ